MKAQGFCLHCKRFYPDDLKAYGECPEGHPLLHAHGCSFCNTSLYFQADDDYIGINYEEKAVCSVCAGGMTNR